MTDAPPGRPEANVAHPDIERTAPAEIADTAESGLHIALRGALGALDLNVAFTAPARTVTALFGPSGSGKTTTLRAIAGLTKLDGRVQCGGHLWQDSASDIFAPAHRRPVGMVFQDGKLFDHLTVAGNLQFAEARADRRGAGAALTASRDELAALLGLSPLLDRGLAKLSGGERQRVAIARALLSRPQVLLMDEPVSALDTRRKQEVLSYLERAIAATNIPVIYVSHAIDEVARLADQVVVIDQGRVRAIGAVDDVLERLDLGPATGRFEAGTVLTGEIVGHDETWHLTHLSACGHPLFVATTPALRGLGAGARVRLRIRARDVALTLATPAPPATSMQNALPGVVTALREEPETAFAELLLDLGGDRLRIRLTRKAVADMGLAVGTAAVALIKAVALDRVTHPGGSNASS
ncbi:MAG: molybdenum ABC transporter ATP-binding protein [Pseudomonadota bacterium]